jgi:hypothetical protein
MHTNRAHIRPTANKKGYLEAIQGGSALQSLEGPLQSLHEPVWAENYRRYLSEYYLRIADAQQLEQEETLGDDWEATSAEARLGQLMQSSARRRGSGRFSHSYSELVEDLERDGIYQDRIASRGIVVGLLMVIPFWIAFGLFVALI